MDYKEAIEILHPDTTAKKLAEIGYYAGFKSYEAEIEAVNEASILACQAMEELQLYKENKLCLIPSDVYERQCAELDELKTPVKPEHVRYKPKNAKRIMHTIYCGKCGKFGQRIAMGDEFCRHCGTPIDWSE